MTHQTNILLITPGFPANEQDDTCIPPLQVFLRNLRENQPEINIHVVAIHYPNSRKPYYWHGIPVYPMGGNNVSFPARLFLHMRIRGQLRKLQKQISFTKVHALWWGEAALLGQWFAKRFRVPLLITLMGQDALPKNRYLKLVKARRAELVAVSNFQAEIFRQTTGRKVDQVIPWGIDPNEFTTVLDDSPIDVLGVGSLIPLKQYEVFVHTIEKLVADFPALKAMIIGSGPEQAKLEQMIAAKELEEHIELKGELPREETLATMQRTNVLLHPSRYESLGYALLEALASGCHVVSLNTGIAQPSDHWSVAHNTNELRGLVKKALEKSAVANRTSQIENRNTHIDHPISKTVSAYADLYTT